MEKANTKAKVKSISRIEILFSFFCIFSPPLCLIKFDRLK
jgi:hypothetical protein